jgi:hypothetical protein
VDNIRVILKYLSLASPEHDHRPPCPANIERLIILVEDKNRGVDHHTLRSVRF